MKKIVLAGLVAAVVSAPAFAENLLSADAVTVSGNVITVASVTAAANGFVVVHAVENGQVVAPASVANAPVVAGENMDIVIELPEAPAAGTEFVLMLHEDTGEAGVFEFGEGKTDVDAPVVVDGAPVTAKITVQ